MGSTHSPLKSYSDSPVLKIQFPLEFTLLGVNWRNDCSISSCFAEATSKWRFPRGTTLLNYGLLNLVASSGRLGRSKVVCTYIYPKLWRAGFGKPWPKYGCFQPPLSRSVTHLLASCGGQRREISRHNVPLLMSWPPICRRQLFKCLKQNFNVWSDWVQNC